MNERQRVRLWDRDEGTCQVCGGPGHEVDHIIPRSKFGKKRKAERDADENLRLICTTCHRARHG